MRASHLPLEQQATSGETAGDYVSKQSRVEMKENVTRVSVEVTVKADNVPEVAEAFLVNITGVSLLGSSTYGSMPSVRRPGDIATITIAENDDARGVCQFDVVLVRGFVIQ